MPTMRPIRALFALALTLLLAGCAPSTERQSLQELLAEAQEAAAEASAADHDHDHAHDHGPHDDADHEHPEDADGQEPSPTDTDQDGPIDEPDTAAAGTDTTSPAAEPSAGAAPPTSAASPEPEGPSMEQHSEFPITATLSTTCVERGKAMTLTVDTGRENSGVAYLAYYADGENGAPPPYGDGHGGNSGDMTDSNGRYEDTWVVSLEAPIGPARVEVVAGWDGMKSTAVVRFEVVAAGSGECEGQQ